MHKKRFYLSPVDVSACNDIIGLEAIHIVRVLRVKVGELIEIFDGLGKEYLAEVIYISNKFVRIKIVESSFSNKESPILVTIAQSFLKDKKMDTLIRQLTELGVNKWIPFIANRSVSVPNKKHLVTKIGRWKKISIEATKQCCRGILPEIYFLENFDKVLKLSESNDINIIFWEGRSDSLIYNLTLGWSNNPSLKNVLIVIGPEGGFEDNDIERAKNMGFYVSSLGSRILRSETASIAACSIIQYVFGDMGKKP